MLLLLACAPKVAPGAGEDTATDSFVLRGASLPGGGAVDLGVRDGAFDVVGEVTDDRPVVDLTGRWVAPMAVDSHVHLAYLPEAAAMVDGGVYAAVDLAAPVTFLSALPPAPTVIPAGPMITAVGGYPTRSWGRDGYGLEVSTAEEARAAVASLVDAGARVIKVPVTAAPVLTDELLLAVTEEAHRLGVKVAAHALEDGEVQRAAAAGVDVLAHTPVRKLSPESIEAWRGRAVVTTLAAFGGSATTLENLAALADGATVLYGTDFGNTRTAGIDGAELALMAEAGLSPAAVLAAVTSTPTTFWGVDGGRLEAGQPANLLVLDADPLTDPLTLARPVAVYHLGQRRP